MTDNDTIEYRGDEYEVIEANGTLRAERIYKVPADIARERIAGNYREIYRTDDAPGDHDVAVVVKSTSGSARVTDLSRLNDFCIMYINDSTKEITNHYDGLSERGVSRGETVFYLKYTGMDL